MNFIKIKNFCTLKDPFKRMQRKVTDWEKNLCKAYSIYLLKDCPEYIKNSQNSTIKQLKKEQKI